MEKEKIDIRKEGRVAVATMNNPPANALSPALRDEFIEKLKALSEDDEVWTLIIQLGRADASAGACSYVDVYGDVKLEALAALELEFCGGFDETALAKGDAFDVIRYSGSLLGEFDRIDAAKALLTDGAWSIDYRHDLGDGAASVRLRYIPEPCTAPLLLLGGIAMLAGGRKLAENGRPLAIGCRPQVRQRPDHCPYRNPHPG